MEGRVLQREHLFIVKKVDKAKHIVYGEVYVPRELDTDDQFMEKEDVQALAHRFMEECRKIDTGHDEVFKACWPVESFISDEDSTQWTPGAWVMAIKIYDTRVWEQIEKGELQAFSFSAACREQRVKARIDLDTNRVLEILEEVQEAA